MTDLKAKKMGFVKVSAFDGNLDRMGQWHRRLSRPACNEYWNPKQPDVITRVTSLGSCASSYVTRKAG